MSRRAGPGSQGLKPAWQLEQYRRASTRHPSHRAPPRPLRALPSHQRDCLAPTGSMWQATAGTTVKKPCSPADRPAAREEEEGEGRVMRVCRGRLGGGRRGAAAQPYRSRHFPGLPPTPGQGPAPRTAVAEGEKEAQVLQAAALFDHDQVDQAVRQVAVPARYGRGTRAAGRQARGRCGRAPGEPRQVEDAGETGPQLPADY